jgi:hypothetical protein
MSDRPTTNLSESELRCIHRETGVDVHALQDLMKRDPNGASAHRHGEREQPETAARGHAPNDADQMTTTGAFDALAILSVLHRREVHFVVIGGVAGYLLGSDLLAANLDICFAPDLENARRLAVALSDMNARRRGSSNDVPDIVDEHALLHVDILTLETDFGFMHCLSNPAGTDGYDDLREHAECMEIDGVKTYVTSLADLIRMKEATGRVKDRLAVVALRAMQSLRK